MTTMAKKMAFTGLPPPATRARCTAAIDQAIGGERGSRRVGFRSRYARRAGTVAWRRHAWGHGYHRPGPSGNRFFSLKG